MSKIVTAASQLHPHNHTPEAPVNTPTPCGILVEYQHNPMGMDEPKPRFSYQLYGVQAQKARQIQLAAAGKTVYDTGWVADDRSQQIAYDGPALKPFTRYEVRIRVKDQDGKISRWNPEEAWFETGFMGTEWSGSKWIGCQKGPTAGLTPQPFLKDFKLKKAPVSARLYATALGFYEAEINREVIGEDVLAPGWTDYNSRVQYQVYDVLPCLKKGDNQLSITLAPGWYHSRISQIWNNNTNSMPWPSMIRAELHLTYAGGKTEIIGTDETFKCCELGGPVRMSDIYDGEIYDATRHPKYMTRPEPLRDVFADEKCDVNIVWNAGPKNRRLQLRTPETITRRAPGNYIVDFGQNFAGRERITLRNVPRGVTITIRHGEMLNEDGSLYTENMRSARTLTVYTAAGNLAEEVYEPHFTFFGFRYLEISGWPGKLTKDDIQGVVLSSDLPRTGLFSCSNELINRLYDNVGWGLRSNLLDVPTDCPQRDERLGWTGDTQVVCNAATFNLYAPDFYSKWLTDMNLQQKADGVYPFVAPTPYKDRFHALATGWTDAAIIVPWQLYLKYGETRLLEKFFPQMDKYIQACVKSTNGTLIADIARYNDWLTLDKTPVSGPLLATAYLAGMARLLAQIATVIGKPKDAKRLEKLYRDIRTAFQKEFVEPEHALVEHSQTAYLMALHFDLLPEALVPLAVKELVHSIRKTYKLHLSTGFLGTPLLLPVLTRFGETELAYELLCQTSYPGWLYPVTQGATTMWERWNSFTLKDGFGDVRMNSFNHYAYGAVAEWFFETIGGIQNPVDAYKHFTLAPQPGKQLTQAEVCFFSPYGLITSAWERDNKTLAWEFTVPDNTTATILPPAGKLTDFSGSCELQHDEKGQLLALPGEYVMKFALN